MNARGFASAALLFALTGLLAAQPIVRIISPADGITVHPGESLAVEVEASPSGAFGLVFVEGFEPIGFSKETGIRPDKYGLTALGSTQSSQLVVSVPIHILVERADSPVSISVYPVVADFTMDQKRYLQVTGLCADKTTSDVTQSSRIEYVSSAPGVATVDKQGIVTPVAPGIGKITVTYGDLKDDVPLRVRQSER